MKLFKNKKLIQIKEPNDVKLFNLLNQIKKDYEEFVDIHNSLSNISAYEKSQDYEDNLNNLRLIFNEVIENNTYKILAKDLIDNQIRELQNKVIIIWDYESYKKDKINNLKKRYNTNCLNPVLDNKGNNLIMKGQNIDDKYSVDNIKENFNNSITSLDLADNYKDSFKYEIYEIPEDYYQEHYQEELNKLKALNLLLDNDKMIIIMNDLENKKQILETVKENCLFWKNKLSEDDDLETIDKIGDYMKDYAQDLPI